MYYFISVSTFRRPARPFKNKAEAEKKEKNIAKRRRKPKVVLPFLHFDERTDGRKKNNSVLNFSVRADRRWPQYLFVYIYIYILRHSTSSAIQMRVRQLKATITAIEWKRKIVAVVFFSSPSLLGAFFAIHFIRSEFEEMRTQTFTEWRRKSNSDGSLMRIISSSLPPPDPLFYRADASIWATILLVYLWLGRRAPRHIAHIQSVTVTTTSATSVNCFHAKPKANSNYTLSGLVYTWVYSLTKKALIKGIGMDRCRVRTLNISDRCSPNTKTHTRSILYGTGYSIIIVALVRSMEYTHRHKHSHSQHGRWRVYRCICISSKGMILLLFLGWIPFNVNTRIQNRNRKWIFNFEKVLSHTQISSWIFVGNSNYKLDNFSSFLPCNWTRMKMNNGLTHINYDSTTKLFCCCSFVPLQNRFRYPFFLFFQLFSLLMNNRNYIFHFSLFSETMKWDRIRNTPTNKWNN